MSPAFRNALETVDIERWSRWAMSFMVGGLLCIFHNWLWVHFKSQDSPN
jgi:hypothetical protein